MLMNVDIHSEAGFRFELMRILRQTIKVHLVLKEDRPGDNRRESDEFAALVEERSYLVRTSTLSDRRKEAIRKEVHTWLRTEFGL